MSRAAVVAAAFLGTLIAVEPTAARSDGPDRRYELTWTIGAQSYQQGEYWVPEQGAIIQARLLPINLYVPEEPVVAENGAPIMGAGERLAALYSSKLAACNTWRGRVGTVSSRDWVCLVDTDRDGRFDGYFQRGGMGTYHLLTLEGEMPERLRPLRPVAYRELPATQLERAPYFSFHYERILDDGTLAPLRVYAGSDMIRFHFKVGTRDMPVLLARDCASEEWPSYCADPGFPTQFRFAGLVLDVLERRGEELRIRVAQPFGTGEVKVERARETRRIARPLIQLQLAVVGMDG
jgi:hypothetical protein